MGWAGRSNYQISGRAVLTIKEGLTESDQASCVDMTRMTWIVCMSSLQILNEESGDQLYRYYRL
jgi:hypothetical protein